MANVSPAQEQLAARLTAMRERIAAAANACGRSPEEVGLIAISKTHPASVIRTLIELGASDLGENRVQEAEEKITEIGR